MTPEAYKAKRMCLGTFSRRARSLATTYIFARVRIIGTLVPFCVIGNSKEFPITQKKSEIVTSHPLISHVISFQLRVAL